MSQPITVSVTMDAASFRRFRWFDLLQHNRIWKRPLVFTAILLVFAGVCLTQLNTRHEAGLLARCAGPRGAGSARRLFLELCPRHQNLYPEAGPR